MKKYLFRILITLCIIIHTMPGRFHLGTVCIWGRDRAWYYILTAFSWIPALLSILFFDRRYVPDQRFLLLIIGLALNSLSNELFFDPINTHRNDMWFAFIMISVQVFYSLIYKHLNRFFHAITQYWDRHL